MALSDLLQNVDLINRETQKKIEQSLWPNPDSENLSTQEFDWEPYFANYLRQCHHALHDQGRHVLVRTHQHIIEIAHLLEESPSRIILKQQVKHLLAPTKIDLDDEVIENTVDLSARLYLMITFGPNKYTISRHTTLLWRHGSLKDFLRKYFDEPQVLSNANVKMERSFTVANMEKIAGIQVRWTDNLADHLRMVDDEDKIISIFHHASFLRRQTSVLFPPGLIDETLRTLALLFPQHDKQTQKWFQKISSSSRVDKTLVKCGQLRLDDRQIETYRFWHDRLVILKQAYDQSRPATISQWWHDRRNGVQWYTFWVAIVVLVLTIFFGIIQSIEGAMQVYKAYHPSTL